MLGLAFPLPALDSTPVTVLSVDSGLNLAVEGRLGGIACPIRVQLAFLSLPDHPEFAKQKLDELCPVGSTIIISVPGDHLTADQFGVVHAMVWRYLASPPDPASAAAPVGRNGGIRTSIQAEMLRAGWARYWDKEGRPEPNQAPIFHAAEQEARDRKMGIYSLPEDPNHSR